MKSALSLEKSPDNLNQTSIWAYPLILIIHMYRYALGPIIGHCCRFHPTCSEYGETALKKYGAWRGSIMTIKRICRCHPFHPGGYDPVK